MNTEVNIRSLVAWVTLVGGATILTLAGLAAIELHYAAVGVGLCFIGNLCYNQGRFEDMAQRERNAFELGRDSVAYESIRSVR